MVFAGVLFHILLTCLNGRFVYSSILVRVALSRGFFYWGYVIFNSKPFAFLGQELTSGVAIVIWAIICDLLAFCLLFFGPGWMETLFTSYPIVGRDPCCGLFYGGNGGSNKKRYSSWGQELTLWVAVVIWVIVWVLPLLVVFVFIFYVLGWMEN